MNPVPRKWCEWAGLIMVTLILGVIDEQTGYELNFFVFYFIPVLYAAWRLGIVAATVFSVLCAVVWSGSDILSGHSYTSNFYAVWNTIIRLGTFLLLGWALAKIHHLILSEQEKTAALQRALSEIKVLEGFLSICCQCKKIRADTGEWQQMEAYISNHTETKFSHGYCPECAKKLLAESGIKAR